MPIPKPQSGQSRDEYVFESCVPFLTTEGYDRDQAIAICNERYSGLKMRQDYKEKNRAWNVVDRKRATWRRKYRKRIGKALDEHVQQMINAIDSDLDNLPQKIELMELQSDMIRAEFVSLYKDVGVDFGMWQRSKLKSKAGYQIKQDEEAIYESIIFEEMRKFIESNAGQKIVSVSGTSKEIIVRRLKELIPEIQETGMAAGDAERRLRKSISNEWLKYKRYRIERIVRTETTGASMKGSLTGAKSTGVPQYKIWNAAFSNTRDHHADAHGQKVDEDEMFTVNGELMEYPGDPSGSAGNVINCFTGDQLTSYPTDKIKNILRSFYDGKVVTITLASGNKFTCTPNHPILTDRGWVKAGSINKGCNLIKASLLQSRFSDFDVKDKPTSFEKIYNSFSVIGHIVRMPRINVNFYGDRPDSDVDIVSVKSKLRYRIHFSKVIQNFILESTNLAKRILFGNSLFNSRFMMKRLRHISHGLISIFSNSLSFILSSVNVSKFVSIFLRPQSNIVMAQNSVDRVSTNFKAFTNTQNRFATIIGRNNFVMRQPVSKPAIFSVKPRINDYFLNGVIVGLDNISNFIDREAISVHSDNVISVYTHDYKGFIYTLETTQQIYEINSIIARNCQCAMEYEVKR